MQPVIGYFLTTYLVTWSVWLAAALTPAGATRALLFLVGVFAPGVVALWFTGRAAGRRGVTTLLARLIDWHVAARWYLFAPAPTKPG